MIKWDEPYGEHFGGGGNARYTQDGTDYDAHGYELDGDGMMVEQPNVIVENMPAPTQEDVNAARQRVVVAAPEGLLAKAVNPAAQDWTAFKTEVGEEAYAAMSKEEKRAGAVAKRLERMN